MDLVELRARSTAVLYTVSSALSGVTLTSSMPAAAIYSHATTHSLGALVCRGLELAGCAPDNAVLDKLKSARREMVFSAARNSILARFDEHKIKYICLKGIVFKSLYPELGLREMTDNDILIDPNSRAEVRRIMRSLGYTVESYGKSHHDIYTKEPFLNFEMHITLFSVKNERFHKYFEAVFEKAARVDDETYECRMSDEDFYIYTKAHEYKHYISGGIGMRTLVDTYVYLKDKGDALDFDYITEECDKIGIAEYESLSRALAMKIFDTGFLPSLLIAAKGGELSLDQDEIEMLDYFASSGTFGKVSRQVENEIRRYEADGGGRTSKIKFLLRNVFPPISFYRESAPIVYKVKILIPFYCIGRLIVTLLKRPARVFAKIKSTVKYKK